MSEFDKFLDRQEVETPESQGEFSVNSESALKKYEALLNDYRDGLLFIFQAAERWRATQVDVKVNRLSIVVKVRVADESRVHLKQLAESPELLEAIIPKSHPLFELGHAFKALSRGNLNTSQSIEVKEDYSSVTVTHHDDKTLRKMLAVSLYGDRQHCRMYFLFQLTARLWTRVPLKIDSLTFPQEADYERRARFASGATLDSGSRTVDYLAHFVHPDRRPLFLPPSVAETDYPITEPEGLVFSLNHKYPEHEVLFLDCSYSRSVYFVPVKHGVALEPIVLNKPYGGVVVAFKADHLETDFSGLRIQEGEACKQELELCQRVLLEALHQLYEVQSHYQPKMSRKELVKNAAKWSVGAPLIAFFLTGGGLWATSWVLAWKLFYGGFAMAGFHSYAKYLPSPEDFTKAIRQVRLGWMTRPEILEELNSAGLAVTPPDLELDEAISREADELASYLEVSPDKPTPS